MSLACTEWTASLSWVCYLSELCLPATSPLFLGQIDVCHIWYKRVLDPDSKNSACPSVVTLGQKSLRLLQLWINQMKQYIIFNFLQSLQQNGFISLKFEFWNFSNRIFQKNTHFRIVFSRTVLKLLSHTMHHLKGILEHYNLCEERFFKFEFWKA
jgi:hypothetical protein